MLDIMKSGSKSWIFLRRKEEKKHHGGGSKQGSRCQCYWECFPGSGGGLGRVFLYSMTVMHFEYGPPGFVECGNPKR